jgi:hypothetical protein
MKNICIVKLSYYCLYILLLLSCSKKDIKKAKFDIINNQEKLSNKVEDIDQTKIDTLEIVGSNKNYGFLVLKKNYEQKNLITIYNKDQSKWNEFILDDSYVDNKQIQPHYIKSEYRELIFNCLEKRDGFYKILVNNEKKTIKYIKETDTNFKFETPAEHIITVVFVGFDGNKNTLHQEPDINSKQIPFNKNEDYYPIKTKGDWLMIEDSNHKDYWIKWRDKYGKIIIELFYDA